MSLENPMVIDSLWKEFEKEPKVVAYCDGCGEEIYEGQDIYVLDDVMLHQESACCEEYISNAAYLETAK